MLTDIGKKMRHMRVDNDELLADMADKVAMSSAFLSAVERGTKKPSKALVDKLADAYKITGQAFMDLRQAADRSCEKFVLNATTPFGRDTAALLARKFSSLSEEDMTEIRNLLIKEGEF